jgi:hypothetical protein
MVLQSLEKTDDGQHQQRAQLDLIKLERSQK